MSCTGCGAEFPANSSFCPSCGQPVGGTPTPLGSTRGIPDNIAGALAYCTLIPAIVFLVVEPFNRSRFIRYHSFQSLLLFAAAVVAGIALKIAFIVLFLIPVIGPLVSFLLAVVVGLAAFLLWVVLVLKALQGEMFKLPYLGDLAEKQAARA